LGLSFDDVLGAGFEGGRILEFVFCSVGVFWKLDCKALEGRRLRFFGRNSLCLFLLFFADRDFDEQFAVAARVVVSERSRGDLDLVIDGRCARV
jgi:hypothetical protein